MRRSPFPTFNFNFVCFITSLFSIVRAAPSPNDSDIPTNSSKKGVSAPLITLAVVGPLVLILACVLVHYLVRRYVDNMDVPEPVVVDLEKEFNPDNFKGGPGTQGSDMNDRDVTRWAQNVRQSASVPGGNWNGSSERSSHERSASASTEDGIPPGLQPGARHSTVGGWGRQSVDGGQLRLTGVPSSPWEAGNDFRISDWYTEVARVSQQPASPRATGPTSPRPLVATPRGPREPTRKSRHDGAPLATQSTYDSRSDETASRRNDSTNSRSSLLTSSRSHR